MSWAALDGVVNSVEILGCLHVEKVFELSTAMSLDPQDPVRRQGVSRIAIGIKSRERDNYHFFVNAPNTGISSNLFFHHIPDGVVRSACP